MHGPIHAIIKVPIPGKIIFIIKIRKAQHGLVEGIKELQVVVDSLILVLIMIFYL